MLTGIRLHAHAHSAELLALAGEPADMSPGFASRHRAGDRPLARALRVWSKRGRVSAAGHGLTWAVDGRWASLHVADALREYRVVMQRPLLFRALN